MAYFHNSVPLAEYSTAQSYFRKLRRVNADRENSSQPRPKPTISADSVRSIWQENKDLRSLIRAQRKALSELERIVSKGSSSNSNTPGAELRQSTPSAKS